MGNERLIRREGWELRFSRFLREHKDKPFYWGGNDCLTFAANAVMSITGWDPAFQYRSYADKYEAQAILDMAGGIVSLIDKHLEIPSHRNILRAKRGDVVVVKVKGEIVAGIVDDSAIRVAIMSRDGLARLPLKKAWRIWSY